MDKEKKCRTGITKKTPQPFVETDTHVGPNRQVVLTNVTIVSEP